MAAWLFLAAGLHGSGKRWRSGGDVTQLQRIAGRACGCGKHVLKALLSAELHTGRLLPQNLEILIPPKMWKKNVTF